MKRWLAAALSLLPVGATAQMVTPPGGAASMAGVLHPGYVANYWYSPYGYGTNAGTPLATGAGIVTCVPGAVLSAVTINQLGGRVATLFAGGNVQFAVYGTGAWGRPAAPIASTANITTASVGNVFASVTATPLQPGVYWWCANVDNATAVMTTQAANPTISTQVAQTLGSTSMVVSGSGSDLAGISIAQTFGTWPTFTSGTAWADVTTAIAAWVAFKVQSSP